MKKTAKNFPVRPASLSDVAVVDSVTGERLYTVPSRTVTIEADKGNGFVDAIDATGLVVMTCGYDPRASFSRDGNVWVRTRAPRATLAA